MKSSRTQSSGAINTGPFSPSIFSSKRLWVRQPNGAPTTILVHQNDIIDDVKLMVIEKYPNSLGKQADAADLLVRLDYHAKMPSGQPASNGASRQRSSFSSPDKTSGPVYITLEPDQNVWSLFDMYFPNGMTMHQALIIEVAPERAKSFTSFTLPLELAAATTPVLQQLHASAGNLETLPTTLALPSRTQTAPTMSSPSLPAPLSLKSPATHPTLGQLSSESPLPDFHSPRPQYNYQQHYSSVKDQSVSPSNFSSLSPSTSHRRAQSNPPLSPLTNGTSQAKNSNSQAILLLPKNFSLASGGSSGNLAPKEKRLSLDESSLSRNTPLLANTLANVGIGGVVSPSAVPVASYPLAQKGQHLHKIDTSTETKTDSRLSPTTVGLQANKATSLEDIPTKHKLEHENTKKSTIPQKMLPLSPTPDVSPPKEPLNEKALGQKLWTKNPSTRERMLPSVSVLVVEDNAINQAILGAFLRRHKMRYKIAKNGREAVEMWSTGGFHIVLMDIQLPVMSGIEATQEIRRLEKINRVGVFAEEESSQSKLSELEELASNERLDHSLFRSPVIIVALTASSNSSVDKTNALRAGCNDYLTKPVNLVWLQNKITEWGCMQALIDFDGWRSKRIRGPEVLDRGQQPVIQPEKLKVSA